MKRLGNMEIIGGNAKYFGQIVKGKRHGKGTEKYNDGDMYTGYYANNKKEG